MEEFAKYFEGLIEGAKKTKESLQVVSGEKQETILTTKTVLNRTLLMPDSKSAEAVNNDEKTAKVAHILDNFERNIKV
jgi:hypothetical protein